MAFYIHNSRAVESRAIFFLYYLQTVAAAGNNLPRDFRTARLDD